MKIPSLRKRSKAANVRLSYCQILKLEQDNIITSILTLAVVLVGFDKLTNFKPVILEWIEYFFVFVGFTGSSIILSLFGKAEKHLLEVIDKKTNIADGVE